MKSKLFFSIIITSFVLFTFSISCSEDKETLSTEQDNEVAKYQKLNHAGDELAKSLGINAKVNVTDIINGKNDRVVKITNSVKSSIKNDWDYDNATTIEFLTEEGKEVISIAIPNVSNPNILLCSIEFEGENCTFGLKRLFDEENNTISYILDESVPNNSKGFLSCMRGFFNSDIGTTVEILGVAGAVGCVACGAVAAFYTGVAALGCSVA